jgi:hypothetical protein
VKAAAAPRVDVDAVVTTTTGVRGAGALGVLAAVVYLWTAPGRIQFPDDEIVFQTAASLWDDGDLTIPGIARRTGEPRDRPTGSFGWETGRDGQRYGFFGHGLSLVAVPAYALASATAELVPPTWAHAVRSDHFVFHRRERRGDWTRLVVSLTNCVVTAMTAWLLTLWVAALGFLRRTALWTGLAYAFGTSAWAYSRTFLSEPLSGLCLVAAAYCVTRWPRGGAALVVAGWGDRGVLAARARAQPGLCALSFGPCAGDRRVAAARASGRGGGVLRWGAGLLLLGQWLRFGDPLETGRFGYYSEFVAPWEGMVAQVGGAGALAVFVLAGAAARAVRVGDAAAAAAGGVLVCGGGDSGCAGWRSRRAATGSAGGVWGPRHLVPVIPVAMLGFAAALERAPWRAWSRAAVVERARGRRCWCRCTWRCTRSSSGDVAAGRGPAGRVARG